MTLCFYCMKDLEVQIKEMEEHINNDVNVHSSYFARGYLAALKQIRDKYHLDIKKRA